MAIEHTCPSCQMRLRVADENAGKKVRCKCGEISVVPAAASTGVSPASGAGPTSTAASRPAVAAATPAQSIVLTCTNCQQTLRAPSSAAGKAVRCKCGQVVPVPAAKPAAKPAAAPAATAAPAAPQTAARPAAPRPTTPPRPASPRPTAGAPAAAARQAAPARVASASAAAPVAVMAAPANPVGSIFDELTDADWNRESPIKRAFAPPPASKDGAVLKQWVDKDAPQSKAKGGIPGGLIALSILNFLSGGFYILGGIAIVALVQAASYVDQLQEAMPILQMGAWIICAYLLFWGIFDLVLAVGLLQRGAWGWCVAAVGYAMSPVMAIYNVVDKAMGMSAGEAVPKMIGMLFGVGITIALTAYIFKDDTRRHFGIKSMTPVIICGTIGVLIGIATVCVLVLVDQSAQSMIPVDANAE